MNQDPIGILSPQANRAPGHCNKKDDDRVQSHHTIQPEWAKRNIKGYDPQKAPAILLPSSSGKAHAIISARQLKAAGLSSKQIKRALSQCYKYFRELGAL